MSLLVSVFTTLQSYHAFANPHFRVHSTNLLYTIEITCWTIWLDPPNAWQSLRHAGYIYTRPFCCAFYWKQYTCRMRSGDETTRVLADSSIFQKGYEWWASSRWSTSFQKNILIGDFNEEWLREVVLDQPDSIAHQCHHQEVGWPVSNSTILMDYLIKTFDNYRKYRTTYIQGLWRAWWSRLK